MFNITIDVQPDDSLTEAQLEKWWNRAVDLVRSKKSYQDMNRDELLCVMWYHQVIMTSAEESGDEDVMRDAYHAGHHIEVYKLTCEYYGRRLKKAGA